MGMITDIQRFSLNDGPGIRTTVFFKGCNAKCAWCHNPETLSMEPVVMSYPDKCIGCGFCVKCDPEAVKEGLPPKGARRTVEAACRCVTGALSIAGREMSVEEILAQIRQDRMYYETSGGGVTLSGGEVMMQPEFAAALLKACHAEGFCTAVETNLMYDFGRLEQTFDDLDLIMADIKLLNDEKHRRYVGVSNAIVMENVKKLGRSGKPFILRTPLIPGVNDDADEISSISAFIAENAPNVMYYELLNLNPLGASKYEALGTDNMFRDTKPLSNDAIDALKEKAQATGIPVRVG